MNIVLCREKRQYGAIYKTDLFVLEQACLLSCTDYAFEHSNHLNSVNIKTSSLLLHRAS